MNIKTVCETEEQFVDGRASSLINSADDTIYIRGIYIKMYMHHSIFVFLTLLYKDVIVAHSDVLRVVMGNIRRNSRVKVDKKITRISDSSMLDDSNHGTFFLSIIWLGSCLL